MSHWTQITLGVDTVDCVIAATCETVQGRVWTRNVKNFPMFPGLESPD